MYNKESLFRKVILFEKKQVIDTRRYPDDFFLKHFTPRTLLLLESPIWMCHNVGTVRLNHHSRFVNPAVIQLIQCCKF